MVGNLTVSLTILELTDKGLMASGVFNTEPVILIALHCTTVVIVTTHSAIAITIQLSIL